LPLITLVLYFVAECGQSKSTGEDYWLWDEGPHCVGHWLCRLAGRRLCQCRIPADCLLTEVWQWHWKKLRLKTKHSGFLC